jgi:hypothetical protein
VASVTKRALRNGVLVRPPACEECGATGRIEGHHPDYDFPLAIEWLCRPCHRKADTRRRAGERLLRMFAGSRKAAA